MKTHARIFVSRRAKATVAAAVGLCLAMLPMASSAPAATRNLQLPSAAGLTIVGASSSVAGAGDVNGDGTPDILIADAQRSNALIGSTRRDKVYVVFGRSDVDRINVNKLGDGGFVIEGAKPGDFAAIIDGAGDVNGDGLADIIVGAPDRLGGGGAYIVFGKADSLPVPLALFDANAQGPLGYWIQGAGGLAGRDVSGAGDINGDGLDDVVIGAPFIGTSYVVFGKRDPLPVFLSLFHRNLQGDAGYLIESPAPDADWTFGVAGLGDVNGDRIPDVGVSRVNVGGPAKGCCNAWVTYGKRDSKPVDVRDLDGGGFSIFRAAAMDAAGDVNGDGLADMLAAGGVLFGSRKPSNVTAGRLKGRGFAIKNIFAYSDDGGGDVNGDGLDDVVMGAPTTDFAGIDAGSASVLFGKRNSRPVDANDLGRQGYRIDGPGPKRYAGETVAMLGDVNGDGNADVAMNAFQGADRSGTTYSGPAIFVVWGHR